MPSINLLRMTIIKAAFYSINRHFIWRSMQAYLQLEVQVEVHYNYEGFLFLILIQSVLNVVRVNGEVTDWFDVNSGTGQRDIHSGPPVFNFCLNHFTYQNLTAQTVTDRWPMSQP